MKQIVQNQYIKLYTFHSHQEQLKFLDNQNCENFLNLNYYSGQYFYCCVSCHTLTKKKNFIISFSSDENNENLNILFWDNNILVIDTGHSVHLVDKNMDIISSFETITPLIGIYITSKNSLLILEESELRIVDLMGKVIKQELFDLIDDFEIKKNCLFIKTGEDRKIINFDI